MGYWKPPSLDMYDPTPRPLIWSQGAGVKWPNPVDEEYYGIGWSSIPGSTPEPKLPWIIDSIAMGPQRSRGNHVVTFDVRKSPYQRLIAYQKLIALRTPEDPINGGLAPDNIDEGLEGTITINYFDFSDDNEPRRKKIQYWTHNDALQQHIYQWDIGKQTWIDEPFDLERDWNMNFADILKGISIGTAMMGALVGFPQIGAAFAKIIGTGASAALTGKPPNPTEVMSEFIALGKSINVGQILSDAKDKDEFASALYGWVGKIKTESNDFISKVDKSVNLFKESLPKIDINAALAGQIPVAISNNVDVASAFKKASQAFITKATNDLNSLYQLRKTTEQKAVFDLTYATLQAAHEIQVELASRELTNTIGLISVKYELEQAAISKQLKEQTGLGLITATGAAERANLIMLIRTLEQRYNIGV